MRNANLYLKVIQYIRVLNKPHCDDERKENANTNFINSNFYGQVNDIWISPTIFIYVNGWSIQIVEIYYLSKPINFDIWSIGLICIQYL